MIKKDGYKIKYDSGLKKLFMYEDFIEEEGCIKADVYFNHDDKEIRIYNFNKKDLTAEEKEKIAFVILKEEYLFPNSFKSEEIGRGNIAQYTLLINGYLLDGTFKERGVKYKSITEELIDNCSNYESKEEISNLLCEINYFYNKYSNEIGKREVKIYLTGKGIFKSFIEYINFAKLFAAYSKSKGKNFRLITSNKFWEREKEILILPY